MLVRVFDSDFHYSLDKIKNNLEIFKKNTLLIQILIFRNNLNEKMGKEILSFLDKLKQLGLDFNITPLPMCMFSDDQFQFIKKYFKYEIKYEFYIDGRYIWYAESKDQKIITNITPLSKKCLNCHFLDKHLCGGIHDDTDIWIRDIEKKFINTTKKIGLNFKLKMKILDIGCGIPWWLSDNSKIKTIFTKSNISYFCIDPCEEKIIQLKKMLHAEKIKNVYPICATGENLQFNNNEFDLIFSFFSYNHFYDLKKIMKNLHNVLKADGKIIFFECFKGKDIDFSKKNPNFEQLQITNSMWDNEFRNHTLLSAINEFMNSDFEILHISNQSLEHFDLWCIAVKNLIGLNSL